MKLEFVKIPAGKQTNIKSSQGFKELSKNPAFSTKTVVIANVGKVTVPKKDDKFYIWLNSTAKGKKERKKRYGAFGIEFNTPKTAFSSSKGGLPIVSAFDNWTVGELIGNNIYIYCDIVSESRFSRIINNLFLYMREAIGGTDKDTIDCFVKIAKDRKADYGQATRVNLKKLEEKIIKLQKELAKAADEQNQYLIQLDQLNEEGLKEKSIKRELALLLHSSKIKTITINDRFINVFTNTLYCIDDRTRIEHEIGQFRIVLNIDKGYISWWNLTNRIHLDTGEDDENYYEDSELFGYMQAPHVFEDGHACEGSAHPIINLLFKSHDYTALISIAIQFVESVNTADSAGSAINHWPARKKKKE